jgi:hypothetical protein
MPIRVYNESVRQGQTKLTHTKGFTMYREDLDSREGFTADEECAYRAYLEDGGNLRNEEYEAWLDSLDDEYPTPEGWDCIEGDEPDEPEYEYDYGYDPSYEGYDGEY